MQGLNTLTNFFQSLVTRSNRKYKAKIKPKKIPYNKGKLDKLQERPLLQEFFGDLDQQFLVFEKELRKLNIRGTDKLIHAMFPYKVIIKYIGVLTSFPELEYLPKECLNELLKMMVLDFRSLLTINTLDMVEKSGKLAKELTLTMKKYRKYPITELSERQREEFFLARLQSLDILQFVNPSLVESQPPVIANPSSPPTIPNINTPTQTTQDSLFSNDEFLNYQKGNSKSAKSKDNEIKEN